MTENSQSSDFFSVRVVLFTLQHYLCINWLLSHSNWFSNFHIIQSSVWIYLVASLVSTVKNGGHEIFLLLFSGKTRRDYSKCLFKPPKCNRHNLRVDPRYCVSQGKHWRNSKKYWLVFFERVFRKVLKIGCRVWVNNVKH